MVPCFHNQTIFHVFCNANQSFLYFTESDSQDFKAAEMVFSSGSSGATLLYGHDHSIYYLSTIKGVIKSGDCGPQDISLEAHRVTVSTDYPEQWQN